MKKKSVKANASVSKLDIAQARLLAKNHTELLVNHAKLTEALKIADDLLKKWQVMQQLQQSALNRIQSS